VETFDYTAVDKLGKRLSGSISARSAREARDQLRGRALTLTELKAAKQKGHSRLRYERTISHKDLTQATRQLSILIDAATPIEEALKVVALQFEKSPMRQVLLDTRARVLEGARLSEAMAGLGLRRILKPPKKFAAKYSPPRFTRWCYRLSRWQLS